MSIKVDSTRMPLGSNAAEMIWSCPDTRYIMITRSQAEQISEELFYVNFLI